jgi:hypothetical protein
MEKRFSGRGRPEKCFTIPSALFFLLVAGTHAEDGTAKKNFPG